ncbi:CAP domain-containing protein [Streptomyces sp. NBC_00083]|uniref:CAP domain-containing protein n=1 Tax=Streptomyces sp. NBC_00083 TaxID=2975647 RepID=UPI00224EAE1B|nr:CAP domain-containing protein [Streptomyces sp. NBC_00083]MCX5385939.1 CAP domain-containing protein [Streptomyces sp. NBC_00083]
MGRHRRSADAPVPADGAAGTDGRSTGGSRRKKRMITPVRTGLLGVSAAVAVGAVAVGSGLLPGGGTYKVSGDIATGGQVQLDSTPTPNVRPQGGESERPTGAAPTPSQPKPPSADAAHSPSTAPSPSASATRSAPSAAPTNTPQRQKVRPPAPAPSKPAAPSTAPTRTPPSAAPAQRGQVPSVEVSAAATVMSLVNQEREQVGCSPVAADPSLGSLATAFSDDMAARGFFDHTDPDGRTPWDRAAKAGVQGLGGENIARGQADAKAVMAAWMNSPDHRANILNCQYKSLGVGVHFGPGGPWWTQDFGF